MVCVTVQHHQSTTIAYASIHPFSDILILCMRLCVREEKLLTYAQVNKKGFEEKKTMKKTMDDCNAHYVRKNHKDLYSNAVRLI